MPKNVIVVGTPRSGTSLAASIFAGQNYFVANDESEQLRDPDHYNPGGYWEAEPLIEANVSLFRRVGYKHHNTWIEGAINDEQVAALEQLEVDPEHQELVGHYEKNHPWVWKDPRLCYTLDYWWPLVDQSKTAVMLVRRDPAETFRSFARIGWRQDTADDRDETFHRLAQHMAAAESAIARLSIPHVEINYADYKADPDGVANRLAGAFELTLRGSDLGFSNALSSSTAGGRFRMASERLLRLIPLPLRNAIRKVVPRSVLQKLFPGRKLS